MDSTLICELQLQKKSYGDSYLYDSWLNGSYLNKNDHMNRSTLGLPVNPEFTHTHVYRFSDAIQPYILCSPLLVMTPFPPSIWVFLNESTLRMSG